MTSTLIKRVIVTGASSGIGAALAKELCSRDVEVIAVSRSKTKLEQVRQSLPEAKRSNLKVIIADLQKTGEISKILKSAYPSDTIDLLINNAGVGVSKSFEKNTTKEIEKVIGTNLLGSVMLTNAVLKERSKERLLRIVFVTSLAGKMGFPNLAVYSASKFALEGFADSLRAEYKDSNVQISILRPGVTATNFFKVASMKEYQNASKFKSMHSPAMVAEVFLKNMNKSEIVVGSDKYFIKLLPFIPFDKRFKFLSLTNRLGRRG